MATQKTKPAERQEYEVLSPYQCPNRKCWHQKGEKVSLLPSEAEFLKLGGKVKAVLATKQKGEG
ncbi:TPA: hypothetical protein NKV81_004472 [Vibrio parahaemolyticus]|nr:hypothetical protein [Vibrio parahaemolyticus]HCH4229652.1 hypothetical protein [Vibrio parahaemolyticus]